ncbi:MAG: hypothetical protein ABI647_16610 [Gemmatimonadota bacterium]
MTPRGLSSALATSLLALQAVTASAQRPSRMPPGTPSLRAPMTIAGPAPTGVQVTASGTAVMVSWAPVAAPAGYRVHRSTDAANFVEVTPGQIPAPPFADPNTTFGATYYYRVVAEYADGRVGATAPTAFTMPQPQLAARGNLATGARQLNNKPIARLAGPGPANVAVTPAPTSVALAWPGMAGVASYNVERSLDPAGAQWTMAGTAGTAAYTDIGLDPQTSVQYRITATYPDGRAGTSAPVMTRTTKPTNPANLKASVATHVITAQITATLQASSVAYGDITLTWDKVPGASAYEVSGTGLPIPKTTQAQSFAIAQMPPGLANYQVIAYFMNGNRRFGDPATSTKVEVVVGSPPVTGFGGVTYAGSGPGIVDFRWWNSNGATGFKLFRGDGEYGPFTEVTNASWAQNWVRDYSSPQRGKTYYYKLLSIFPSAPIAFTGVTRIDIPATVALTGLTATSPGPGRATLTWTPPAGATEIMILRGKGTEPMDWIRDSWGPMKLPGGTARYDDSSLWNGATYRYNVCAKIQNGSACSQVSVAIAR